MASFTEPSVYVKQKAFGQFVTFTKNVEQSEEQPNMSCRINKRKNIEKLKTPYMQQSSNQYSLKNKAGRLEVAAMSFAFNDISGSKE